ncbi:hypothetical protein [Photobacterium sanguinicancri]|uniref:hypothetical protein n=1 Tax=Photobacterium sanguinicancri TaxID=875932 RepID=UPI0026E22CA8|nr:hypothetical protein [Photobacterium sanguinicancri]MDO6498602.1 hypothetical protein [Photobacterium sanguinicancri]
MKSPVDKLLNKHENLIHSDGKKVLSHTQRDDGEWVLHTIMIEDCDAPFKFRRTKQYRSLKGQQVNLTYYPDNEKVAGFDIEVMRVVRIKRY